jgi:hypothetical protein
MSGAAIARAGVRTTRRRHPSSGRPQERSSRAPRAIPAVRACDGVLGEGIVAGARSGPTADQPGGWPGDSWLACGVGRGPRAVPCIERGTRSSIRLCNTQCNEIRESVMTQSRQGQCPDAWRRRTRGAFMGPIPGTSDRGSRSRGFVAGLSGDSPGPAAPRAGHQGAGRRSTTRSAAPRSGSGRRPSGQGSSRRTPPRRPRSPPPPAWPRRARRCSSR